MPGRDVVLGLGLFKLKKVSYLTLKNAGRKCGEKPGKKWRESGKER
jgi:hypothetical protein